jgi:BASS family bile acid:Na+ symporter
MVIMFGMGMGMSMSIKDFVQISKMPKSVLIGLVGQFSIMSFIGFGLATATALTLEIAAGIILVG